MTCKHVYDNVKKKQSRIKKCVCKIISTMKNKIKTSLIVFILGSDFSDIKLLYCSEFFKSFLIGMTVL